MPSTVRQMNEARARSSLLKNRVMSRADLARELSLTRATASSIVGSLLEAGEVVEGPEGAGLSAVRTGRPAVQLKLNADHAFFLGAYVGATRLYLCAVDFAGSSRHVSERSVQPGKTTPDEMAQELAAMVAKFLKAGVEPDRVRGLAVAVPGVVNIEGNVLRAPPLDWFNVPLMGILSEVIESIPVVAVLNDANAFAIAAEGDLGDKNLKDALFILLEDGVGGCIVSDGRLIAGRDGFAGEFGHIPVGKNSFFNLTGIEGALENFVSRRAVLNRYEMLGGSAGNFREFIANLSSGESQATQVQSECIHYFSRGLCIVASLLNPQAFVIGGRASAIFRNAEEALTAKLTSQLIQGTTIPRIFFSSIGPEGPAIGSALSLQKSVFALPAETSD